MTIWRRLIITGLIGLTAGFASAQTPPAPQPDRPATQQDIEDTIEVLYMSQFPKAVGLTDDQLVKVLPLVKQWINLRRNLNGKRQRLQNQLRQKAKTASPEELQQLTHDFDEADPAMLEKVFLGKVNPFLSPQQQANLRIFQGNFDQRIRQMINQARQGNVPPQRPAAVQRQELQEQRQQQKQEQKLEQKEEKQQERLDQKPLPPPVRRPNKTP